MKDSEKSQPRERADTTYYRVYELFGSPWPIRWKKDKTQIEAAKNLLGEQEFDEIEAAVAFSKKHKSDKFCPRINTPYDLDAKWRKLEDYFDSYAKKIR